MLASTQRHYGHPALTTLLPQFRRRMSGLARETSDHLQQGIARELGVGRQTIGLYSFALGHDKTKNALLKRLRDALLWNTITAHSHIRR